MVAVSGRLSPDKPQFVVAVGRKRSGKSVLAKRFWQSYPYDRLVIDPTGDAVDGSDTEELVAPLPARWPLNVDDRRVSLRFRADPGSPTYEDDLDRAVGLAFFHPRKRCLLWVDEMDEVVRAGRTKPHTRRMLRQNRHQGLSVLLCGPRPVDVDPLAIAQADLVFVFDLPNPNDRRRVADVIGYDPKEFDAAVRDLGEHEFLRYDATTKELAHFPPLPLTSGHQRQAS